MLIIYLCLCVVCRQNLSPLKNQRNTHLTYTLPKNDNER